MGNITYGSMHRTHGGSLNQGGSKKVELMRLFGLSPVIAEDR